MRSSLSVLFMLGVTALSAQEVQWVTTGAIDYDINPDMPNHLVCASNVDQVYVARSTSLNYLYGSVYGDAVVERLDAQGNIVWSFDLGGSLLLQAMASDANGKVVLGGRFFNNLQLNGDADLPALYGNTYPETFLIALDSEGQLLWQQNITPNDPMGTNVQDITFDEQGRAWYATCDFFRADIKRVDDAGNDVETRPIEDAKTIGSLSFDPWGGLYVSGSASTPGITVNGSFFPLSPQYNFFVARMGADGTTQWLRNAEDITFQRPYVVADDLGHAYLIGTPFDSLSWGDIHFHAPQWNSTFFLTRLDSMGVFEWGFQPPIGDSIIGQFTISRAIPTGLDAQGNVHLLGITQGQIDWGNNVITSAGSTQQRAITLLKLDTTGTPQWELHGGSTDHDVPQGLDVLPSGECHVAVLTRDTFLLGSFTANLSTPALVVARISPEGSTGIGDRPSSTNAIRAYPSPFENSFQLLGDLDHTKPLRVMIRDSSGRLVGTGTTTKDIGSALHPGHYLVEVAQGVRVWHTRVVKQ